MPAGSKWVTRKPRLRKVPRGALCRVHRTGHGATAANPHSLGRLALPGLCAMLFAADSEEGALWETILRAAAPDAEGTVAIRFADLRGWQLSWIRLRSSKRPLLHLGQPWLRSLFPDPDGPEAQAVADLLTTLDYPGTHAQAAALRSDLIAVGVPEMPVLAWPSRMFPKSTVYLFYAPPMQTDWWEPPATAFDDVPLDTRAGIELLRRVLARYGFTLEILDYADDEPPEDADA